MAYANALKSSSDGYRFSKSWKKISLQKEYFLPYLKTIFSAFRQFFAKHVTNNLSPY